MLIVTYRLLSQRFSFPNLHNPSSDPSLRENNRPFRNSSGNRGEFVKDSVEIGHLTKFDVFRVNIDQVMDLEIWFKIHTNVSNFETASPKTI